MIVIFLEEIKAPLVWWISWFVTIVDELWKSNEEPTEKNSASNLVPQSLKAVRIQLWKHQKTRHLINRVYFIQIEKMVVCYAGRKKANGFMANVFLKKVCWKNHNSCMSFDADMLDMQRKCQPLWNMLFMLRKSKTVTDGHALHVRTIKIGTDR